MLRTSRRAIGAPVLGSWFLGLGILGISGLVVGWLVVGCRLVGCWLVGCSLLVGWWLVVGCSVGWWLVVGCCFGWFVARSLRLVGRLRATKLLRTTWYHPFEPGKEVVGSWWRHVVAWSVGCWLRGWAVGSKT